MAWARIDDALPDHPKVVQLNDPIASWMHVCAITYCARFATDGHLPEQSIYGFVRGRGKAASRRLAAKLVDVGLWERTETGYFVHDYLDYNPSRAELEAKKAEASERMSRMRKGKPVRANKSRSSREQGRQQQQPLHDPEATATGVEGELREGQDGPAPGVVAAAEQHKQPDLVQQLTAYGVLQDVAARLVDEHPDRCREQIAWISGRNSSQNLAGMLVKSITENWPEPSTQTSPSSHLPWVGSAANERGKAAG